MQVGICLKLTSHTIGPKRLTLPNHPATSLLLNVLKLRRQCSIHFPKQVSNLLLVRIDYAY